MHNIMKIYAWAEPYVNFIYGGIPPPLCMTTKLSKIITYKNQSTARIRLTSSTGRPTEVRTINIVTSPALGIAAAPIAAHVAVRLKRYTD